ncbi:MAG: GNAT family N-acetyltransferase [Acidobacteria bacterium]|nr:GNAT family N-acetyltransferase [Acidobacteriota bacterium]
MIFGVGSVMEDIRELETERLRLRQWTVEDFPTFADYYSRAQTAQFVGGVKTREEAWRHMALQAGHWSLMGFGYWPVEEKGTSDFVGCVGLWQSIDWPEMELGYWLLEKHYGKGYAREAGMRCKDIARHVLKAPSLVSYIDARNKPSIRLAERMGAVYEKTVELANYGPHGVYRYF